MNFYLAPKTKQMLKTCHLKKRSVIINYHIINTVSKIYALNHSASGDANNRTSFQHDPHTGTGCPLFISTNGVRVLTHCEQKMFPQRQQ